MLKRTLALLSTAAIIGVFGVSAAFAQVAVPSAGALHQNDQVNVVPYGAPSAQSVYATPGNIAGVEQYSYQIPLTAFTITPPNGTSLLYLNPAGTLATGTLTMQASPSDGQKFCVQSSQTQTAITVSANTGQTISTTIGLGALTAMVQFTRYCYLYQGALATWIRTQ